MGDYYPYKVEVVGSSPTWCTKCLGTRTGISICLRSRNLWVRLPPGAPNDDVF